jgi:hypothetical protein
MFYKMTSDGFAKARENSTSHRARFEEFQKNKGVLPVTGAFAHPMEE